MATPNGARLSLSTNSSSNAVGNPSAKSSRTLIDAAMRSPRPIQASPHKLLRRRSREIIDPDLFLLPPPATVPIAARRPSASPSTSQQKRFARIHDPHRLPTNSPVTCVPAAWMLSKPATQSRRRPSVSRQRHSPKASPTLHFNPIDGDMTFDHPARMEQIVSQEPLFELPATQEPSFVYTNATEQKECNFADVSPSSHRPARRGHYGDEDVEASTVSTFFILQSVAKAKFRQVSVLVLQELNLKTALWMLMVGSVFFALMLLQSATTGKLQSSSNVIYPSNHDISGSGTGGHSIPFNDFDFGAQVNSSTDIPQDLLAAIVFDADNVSVAADTLNKSFEFVLVQTEDCLAMHASTFLLPISATPWFQLQPPLIANHSNLSDLAARNSDETNCCGPLPMFISSPESNGTVLHLLFSNDTFTFDSAQSSCVLISSNNANANANAKTKTKKSSNKSKTHSNFAQSESAIQFHSRFNNRTFALQATVPESKPETALAANTNPKLPQRVLSFFVTVQLQIDPHSVTETKLRKMSVALFLRSLLFSPYVVPVVKTASTIMQASAKSIASQVMSHVNTTATASAAAVQSVLAPLTSISDGMIVTMLFHVAFCWMMIISIAFLLLKNWTRLNDLLETQRSLQASKTAIAVNADADADVDANANANVQLRSTCDSGAETGAEKSKSKSDSDSELESSTGMEMSAESAELTAILRMEAALSNTALKIDHGNARIEGAVMAMANESLLVLRDFPLLVSESQIRANGFAEQLTALQKLTEEQLESIRLAISRIDEVEKTASANIASTGELRTILDTHVVLQARNAAVGLDRLLDKLDRLKGVVENEEKQDKLVANTELSGRVLKEISTVLVGLKAAHSALDTKQSSVAEVTLKLCERIAVIEARLSQALEQIGTSNYGIVCYGEQIVQVAKSAAENASTAAATHALVEQLYDSLLEDADTEDDAEDADADDEENADADADADAQTEEDADAETEDEEGADASKLRFEDKGKSDEEDDKDKDEKE